MPSTLRAAAVAAFAGLALTACSQTGSNVAGGSSLPGTQSTATRQIASSSESAHELPGAEIYEGSVAYHRVCGDVDLPGLARCFVLMRDDAGAHGTKPDGTPIGLNPSDLQSAYNLDVTGGTGQTVAIVDAYDNPNLESDLQVYRAQWGLPTCSSSNNCFQKVSQTGGTNYPQGNTGWGLEESLDVDMVSANCPNCNILVVEADSNSDKDLGASVKEASKLGALIISNSYGGGEYKTEDSSKSDYNVPAVVTASAGDSGYGVEFPAASSYVTAVGGTTLDRDSKGKRGWIETVWEGSGSGCSLYATKPTWQKDKGCKNRTVADVAYVASPGSSVAIYDTYGGNGWTQVGGTSVGSPSIAAIYALAGNASTLEGTGASYGYAHTKDLYDVTGGSNGTCKPKYLCNGEVGYDGPTGNGTPDGTGAF